MKTSFLLLIPFCALMYSCEAQGTKTKTMQTSTQHADAKKEAPLAPYELHGIPDPGINNMIAFAVQTPTAWKFQQNFSRVWNGSTPIAQLYMRVVSPDQGSSIEFLPHSPYYYADGPTTRSLRQTAASYGMPQQHNPGELAPMPPLDYLKRLYVPYLAQLGLRLEVTGEQNLPSKQVTNTMQSYYAYVDGTANGKKVRVDCMLNLTTTNMNGEVYYNWEVYPTIIITDGDLDVLYKHVTQARVTFRANPSWQQRNNQLVRNGNIANEEINRRNYEMQRDYYNHIQKKGQEVADARNASNDKRHESFRDMIGGEAKYEDPETGSRVKLADKYNHVYKDRNGRYYGSNEAVNEAAFDWVELQRLETKDY